MNKYLKRSLIVLVLAFAAYATFNMQPAPVPIATLVADVPAVSGICQQCVGVNCYSAPCNIECLHYGSWCENRVMGGGSSAFNVAAYQTDREGYDYAEFVNFRVMRNCQSMDEAGVPIGATITHVDNQHIDNVKDFAAAVLDLRGKHLRFIAPDGARQEVTLK